MFRLRSGRGSSRMGSNWPKGTALRACPNPLNTSRCGFLLKKWKLKATAHLQIHRYRLMYITITRKNYFIFVLSQYNPFWVPWCSHGEVTWRWCQPTYRYIHWKAEGTVLAVCFCKMSDSWPASTVFIHNNTPTPSSSQVCLGQVTGRAGLLFIHYLTGLGLIP